MAYPPPTTIAAILKNDQKRIRSRFQNGSNR
jgi:hypothetical protein